MTDFVEECRREWKRLGVADPVAEEMAVDLAADLAEAAAEGASAEEVLGSAAFDARSFASAWAAERGLIRRPRPTPDLWRRFRMPAAIAALTFVAIVGAVLVIASPAAPRSPALAIPPPPLSISDPYTVISLTPPSGGRVFAVEAPFDTNDSALDARTVGSVLLILGLAGIVPLTIIWSWVARPSPLRDV